MQPFDPPNSFRWEKIDYHGQPALRVQSSRNPKRLDFKYMYERGETDAAALERVRRSCAESDRCAREPLPQRSGR